MRLKGFVTPVHADCPSTHERYVSCYEVDLEVVFDEADSSFLKDAQHLTDAVIRIAHQGIRLNK